MGRKLSFRFVNKFSDVIKGKFIFKKELFRILVAFPPIIVADTKITCGHNFVAPLKSEGQIYLLLPSTKDISLVHFCLQVKLAQKY